METKISNEGSEKFIMFQASLFFSFNSNIDTRKLFKECLNSGVLINPGFIYHDHHHTVRLSFAYPSFEEMEEGILTMKALLADNG
ncbi:hypothetical protein BIZ35_11505 [Heyndrickxia coagulans]|nr:hypothetical protein BIZ35_11505 [Heyndrickxia coagulans]KYC74495.1 hypothetical protein B4096_1834 [Heyndrickxia coagulans]WNE61189.1 hypothetical protein KIY57_15050 [Heyndrickxia coagulans]